MRTPVMAGNWKMFKTAAQTSQFFESFNPLVRSSTGREIVLCPTFVNLQTAVDAVRGTAVGIGGQNLFWQKEGAYTGEISADMLKAVGCRWVIIAHSERRQYFGETDESACKKTLAALDAGLTPIFCMGETLAQREANETHSVLHGQFEGGLSQLSAEQFAKVVVAYEPIWAIGTGRTATPEIAGESHSFIRGHIRDHFGEQAAEDTRVLYGGSVKPDNIKVMMAQGEIDGVLVGGASLDPNSFAAIVNY